MTSVRPNGPRRPYDLNRLELRICDLVTDPADLLAITTLLELRVLNLARHPINLIHYTAATSARMNWRSLQTATTLRQRSSASMRICTIGWMGLPCCAAAGFRT